MKKGLREIIEDYKKRGIGNESHMWKMVDMIDDELMKPLKEHHPNIYWDFMRDIHEIYEGEHFNQEFAEWEVSQMHHKGTDGTLYKGQKWGLEQTTPIFIKIKSQLTKPYNEFDFYVILHSIWHDCCVLYHKWKPEYTEEQMTQMYIDATINWLNDEDYGSKDTGKAWRYFEDMHDID